MKSGVSQRQAKRLIVSSFLIVVALGCEKVQKFTGQPQNSVPTTTPSAAPAAAPKVSQPIPMVKTPKPAPIDSAKFLADLNTKRSEQITDDDLKTLANLESGREQVTFLNLAGGGITAEGLQHLAKLPELTQLDLSSTNTDERGFAALGDCPKLRKLTVKNVIRISPQGWGEISKLSQLECLDVSGTRGLSKVDVANFRALINLRELDLSSTAITDDVFKPLAEIERLEILKIYGNGNLMGHGLQAFTRSKSRLRELHASGTPLGHSGLRHIKTISTLEFLDLSNSNLNDQQFAELKGATNVVHLRIGGKNSLSNAGLQTVLTLSKLKILDLEGLLTINDQGLGILSKKSGLQTLNAKKVPFTRQAIEKFQKIQKNCEVLVSE